MEKQIYKFDLDLRDSHGGVCINVSRGDTHRRLVIGFHQDGRPYPLPSGCRAVLFGKKADGTLLYNDCLLEGNSVIYDMTSQTTAEAGLLECSVRIYDSEDMGILTSPIFEVRVLDSAEDDSAVESGSEFTALSKAIFDTHTLMDATEEVRASTLAIKEEVEAKLQNGDFVGPKGDKGDKGDVGGLENCTPKTPTMTNPVGVDKNGQLWSEGIPDTYLTEDDIGQSVASLGDDGIVPKTQLPFIPASSKSLDATLSASGWSTTSPYTQRVSVAGVTPTGNGYIGLSVTATPEQRRVAREGIISVYAQNEGSITVVADGYRPGVDIPVTVVILG